ncbi:alanine racemase [Austwickia chelonae]|nr:alanine racemase [Austwickia chelonae]
MTTERRVGPARLIIDLDAIEENTRELRRRSGDAHVMAVVKADGYGHGLLPAARSALAGGATWLGTALLGEALELRRQGINGRILSWLHTPGSAFDDAILADIDLAAADTWSLEEIAQAARLAGRTARVHLKVDTGLGRNGAYGDDVAALISRAAELEREGILSIVGLMSHFAYADAPGHPTVRAQQDTFRGYADDCERAGIDLEVRHLANSAATLTDPDCAFDMVRPGLALYGLSPVPQTGDPEHFGLRPAMTCSADLALVKTIPAGQGVSYGHEYRPARDTRIGVVPVGYADGIPRSASGTGPVQVGGTRMQIAGRVCMDQYVLDLGPDSPCRAGDEVILFGDPALGVPSAQDWADAAGTISYEIITRMSTRLPREYVQKETP